MPKNIDIEKEKKVAQMLAKDIFLFVKTMFNLEPQPAKPKYQKKLKYIYSLEGDLFEEGIKLIKPEWFGDYNEETKDYTWFNFVKGKHLTWQQTLLLMCANKAVAKKIKWRLSVASGHGCHAKGTKIMMFDGTLKNVEDIKIGDKLMGDDETPRNVLSLVRGKEQMYRIKYHSGEFYDVNENHILSLVATNSQGKQKRGDIINVRLKDYLKWSKNKKKTQIGYKTQFKFKEQNLPIDPYLFGIWLGGKTSKTGTITNPDTEIHKYLKLLGGHFIKKNSYTQIRIPNLTKALKLLGVLNNKHIPHIYKTSSVEQRLQLLAGLLDSDGFLEKGGSTYKITQKRAQLANDIVFLSRSLGMNAIINKKTPSIKSNRIYISRNIWNIPCKVKRKIAIKPNKPQRERLSFGFTVEKLNIDNYYGFRLDGNHLYTLGDFTVTHNCGKTSACAIIILWFLFGRVDSQVACTAPTATQMHDVLWKELALWISRMPDIIKNLYEHNKDYVRIKQRPDSWFARAKTSSKENSEALAGIHAEWVMLVADEASAVEERIFTVMDGALTSGNFLVILIGNPTRNDGYFYNTHHKNKDMWVNISFSGIESPLVDKKYEEDQARQHGRESEEYGIRVLGKFPSEDTMSIGGYVRLISSKDINIIPKSQKVTFGKDSILGIDPSGEGDDKTSFCIRDEFKAKIIFKETTSNPKSIAEKILTFIDMYDLNASNVIVDAFGIGTTISAEVAKASNGKHIIQSLNVGEPCDYEEEKKEYINKRALYYHKGLRNWIKLGGQIVEDDELLNEFETIYYKRNLQGKVQIMPKIEMRKRGYGSPNCLDSLMVTFHSQIIKKKSQEQEWEELVNNYDPFGGSF